MFSRWHSNGFLRWLAPRVVKAVTLGLYRSLRMRFFGLDHLTGLLAQARPFILCAWHERIVLAPMIYNRYRPKARPICLMVSMSKDGDLAAAILPSLGIHIVRGSADSGAVRKGGSKALRDMVRLVRRGMDMAFFPDGPHGPPLAVKHGVLATARMTQAPILPVSWDARWKRRIRSWDRMLIPLPFSRVHVHVGEPVSLASDSHDEDSAELLKQRLDLLCEAAAQSIAD